MIDTHCHLTFPVFSEAKSEAKDQAGVLGVLARASKAGVRGCITISTTTQDCLEALALANRFAHVWCTAGVHPLHSHEGPHEWANLRRVVAHERCVAWGELGLDNHYETPARDVQHAVLAEQLDFIQRVTREGVDKPVVLHCREAFDDLIPVLRATSLDPARMVFHCFTSGPTDIRKVLDFGACVSFTGVVTYANAKELRDAVRLVPEGRLMIETDAPFLSPHPHRGVRPCEPWMASVTGREIASLRGVAWESFEPTVARTVEGFFGIVEPGASGAHTP